MKKLLLIASVLTAFALISCSQANNESGSGDTQKEVDLRNKNDSGKSVKRSAAPDTDDAADTDEDAPIGKYVKKDPDCRYGSLTDEDLEKLVSFEDDEKGFKINYTTPEALKEYALMTRIIYIDNNKNWSTRQNIELAAINKVVGSDAFVKDSYSWVYPLVLPGKTYTFAIQFQYYKATVSSTGFNVGEAGPDFQLYYSVTPKHGLGIIDDLPEDYNSVEYTEFKDGVFSLVNVIPVESEVKLQKSIGLYGTTSSTKYWETGEFAWVDGYDEDITDSASATILDMTKRGKVTDYPYVYCQFLYKYYLEGFDDSNFQTPDFMSQIIKNTYFVKK